LVSKKKEGVFTSVKQWICTVESRELFVGNLISGKRERLVGFGFNVDVCRLNSRSDPILSGL
jgi:hypothetical protein